MTKEKIDLYLRAMPRLKRYARRIKKVEDREDFIQHSLERILKEGEIRDLYWYKTDVVRLNTDRKITRNRYIKKLDKQLNKATAKSSSDLPLPCVGYAFHKEPNQEINLEEKLFVEKFLSNKRELNTLYRGFITLYTMHDYSNKELAEIFGLTESRVSQILKKAKKYFKEQYAHLEV